MAKFEVLIVSVLFRFQNLRHCCCSCTATVCRPALVAFASFRCY